MILKRGVSVSLKKSEVNMMEYSIEISKDMTFDTSFIGFNDVAPPDTLTRFEQLAFLAKANCVEESELPKMLHAFFLGQPYGEFWMYRIDVKRDRFILYVKRADDRQCGDDWIVFPFDETVGKVTITNQRGDESYQIDWVGSLVYVAEIINHTKRQYEPIGSPSETNENYLGKCALTEQYPATSPFVTGH